MFLPSRERNRLVFSGKVGRGRFESQLTHVDGDLQLNTRLRGLELGYVRSNGDVNKERKGWRRNSIYFALFDKVIAEKCS